MRPSLAFLIAASAACVCVPRPLAGAGTPERGTAEADEGIRSLGELIDRTYKEALAWSPRAKLYCIAGTGPRNKKEWADEQWRVEYGDPESEDGYFAVLFVNDHVSRKVIAKNGLLIKENYWDGKFNGTTTTRAGRLGNYHDALPVTTKFLDGPDLQELLGALGFRPNAQFQYDATLIRWTNEFAKHTLTADVVLGGGIPKSLKGRSLWFVNNGKEQILIDAETGRVEARRPFII